MKMRKKYMFFVQGLVIVFIFSFILFYNLNRSRVIVLYSYSNQVPEVVAFSEGFFNVTDDLKNPYIVNSYMNISRANSSEERTRFGLKSREFIDEFDPELIVAVGEEAQEYAARYYGGKSKIKVIFACIRDHHPYSYDTTPNVTGILEEMPLTPILEVLKETYPQNIHPDNPLELIFLGDKSFRVTMEKDYILRQKWHPFIVQDFIQLDTFEEWQHTIKSLQEQKKQAVILLLNYDHLKIKKGCNGKVSSKDVLTWTLNHSPYPMIGLYENHFYDGAFLSFFPSARESGQKAATYVQNVMKGKAAKDMTVSKTKQFMVGIRHTKHNPFPFVIPKSFEVIAQTNNRYVDDEA
jgi:ABC-type uncharacterized transport system substrate-binding protein